MFKYGLNNGHRCDMGFNITSAAYNSHEGLSAILSHESPILYETIDNN